MNRTIRTATQAAMAAPAMPAAAMAGACSYGFHFGYSWRNSEPTSVATTTKQNSKKRTTRRLGMAST
jgi:hypothetical protein